jgi:hypothetical protein
MPGFMDCSVSTPFRQVCSILTLLFHLNTGTGIAVSNTSYREIMSDSSKFMTLV